MTIIHMTLEIGAPKDMEIGHLDYEQAYLIVDIEPEIYIELSEQCQEFPNAMGRLDKAVYGMYSPAAAKT